VPCKTADALATANALVQWFVEFGTVLNWVSDQGSHFKNNLIKKLRQLTRGHHHFTLPYTPWGNGTVEVVCRELLRCLKVLGFEFKPPFKAWPSLLPMVQSGLNNTILPRLENRTSTEVFLGLPTSTPLETVVRQGAQKPLVLHMSDLRARQLLQMVQLQTAVEKMHKLVHALTSKDRTTRVALHNAHTGVRPVNFAVGDYVLRAVLTKERGRKTDICWKGPYVVLQAKSDYLFEVCHMLNGDKQVVRGTRLKVFRNASWAVTEEADEHLAYLEDKFCVVDHFVDLRKRTGTCELKMY
jgi:hypothetical protein